MKKLFWVKLAGGLFLTDLAVKKEIEEREDFDSEVELVPGKVGVKRLHNYGMAGSHFSGHADAIAKGTGIVTAGGAAAFAALLPQKGRTVQKCGMALLMGGALSNLCDRLKKGYVVDYLCFHTPWKWLNSLVFNLADFFIFAGGALVSLGAGLERR